MNSHRKTYKQRIKYTRKKLSYLLRLWQTKTFESCGMTEVDLNLAVDATLTELDKRKVHRCKNHNFIPQRGWKNQASIEIRIERMLKTITNHEPSNYRHLSH